MIRGNKLVLLTVVLLLCLAAFWALRQGKENNKTASAGDSHLLSFDSEAVTALAWTYNGVVLDFTRENGSWSYTGDSAFPVDNGKLDGIVNALEGLRAVSTVEAAGDMSEYGLDAPVCSVTLTAGKTLKLRMGNESSSGGECYLSTGDGRVYLADDAILDSFTDELTELAEKETVPAMTEILSFTLETGGETLALEHKTDSGLAYSRDYVWFVKDGDGYKPLDGSQTEKLIDTVRALSFAKCASYNADEKKLQLFGLDDPSAMVTVDYKGEDGEEAEFALELGDQTEAGRYARIKGSDMVCLISEDDADALMSADYDSLQPMDVIRLDRDLLKAFDISVSGESYHIDVSGESGYSLGDAALDADSVDELLSALSSMPPIGVDEGASFTGMAELSFVFYQDSESFPVVELRFYPYDDSCMLVYLNGETRLLTGRSEVLSVERAARALVSAGAGK